MLYWLVTAMYPQFLITLDENDEEQDVTVRVGQAVNTVGLAGTRSGISGVSPLFQFPFFFPHTSPSFSTSPHLLRSWVSTNLYLISLHLRFTPCSTFFTYPMLHPLRLFYANAQFQTHQTPVRIATGDRAELGTNEFFPYQPVLEGLVVLKKNEGFSKDDN
jgi:hypothetical protein